MEIPEKKLFLEVIKKGKKELFLSLLPHYTISQKAVFKILKWNMKEKRDFIIKSLFLKKYIWHPDYIKELLFYAIRNKYELGVTRALNKGANPNSFYREKHAFAFACKNSNLAIVKILLEHGADPNPQLNKYDTPIAIALDKLNMELIELLSNHGANLEQWHLNHGLANAAKADRFDLVDQFILMGAKFEMGTYFGTTFVNPKVVPKLLKRDFSFKLNFISPLNPFSLAVKFGLISIVKEFVKHGKHKTPTNEFRKTMSEALFPAAANENTEIFHYLLKQGADINFTIHEKTPFDHAVEFKRLMFAAKIKKLGGKSYLEMERDA